MIGLKLKPTLKTDHIYKKKDNFHIKNFCSAEELREPLLDQLKAFGRNELLVKIVTPIAILTALLTSINTGYLSIVIFKVIL